MVELIEHLFQTNEISEEVKEQLLSKHYGNSNCSYSGLPSPKAYEA
jgi:hypothetical protein|tara:strand:- start:158 stop:295 length:138 start_codon:yes stop_codon:yes gene_type:complete